MSFGLKTTGATYQRAIQACLSEQIERIAEAYVGDVVVKTQEPLTLIDDLTETFTNLRAYKWKLNPTKCVFGIPLGQLLGFLVIHRGIEASTTDSSNHSDGPPALHQGCPEVNRVHGCP